MTNKLPVIFRMYRGELTAYFPSEAWDDEGHITCYANVGQHGAAHPQWLHKGRLAKPEEYADLLAELRGIYETHDDEHVELIVRKRDHVSFQKARREQTAR